MAGVYTRKEVELLLSIKEREAREADEGATELGVGELPLVVRWHDVHTARRRVIMAKREQEMIQLRAQGYEEREIAELVGLHRSTVNRAFRASVDETLAVLGGERGVGDAVSRPSACLACGARPRARAIAVRRSSTGLWRPVGEEYQLSSCAVCLPRHVRDRVVLRELDVERAQRARAAGAHRIAA